MTTPAPAPPSASSDAPLQAPDSVAVTTQSRSNLAISFAFLPPEKRQAMSAFYAFCRVVDDIADSQTLAVDQKLQQLDLWRKNIQLCYTGQPELPLARELAPVLRKYLVPPEYLEEILLGVTMDLHNTSYATWEELHKYCYRVASCVGLVSIEIFGYSHPQSRRYAELLGLAFQTTNILRDVRADFNIGRIYLPQEDFERCHYSRDELRQGVIDERALRLFRLMAERSEHFYAAAERMLPGADRENMLAAQIMRRVYYRVLTRIRENGFDVWNRRAKLGPLRKMWLMRSAIREERGFVHDCRPTLHAIVVGGGFAGCAAALHLARTGHRVTLIESRSQLGGRTHSFKVPEPDDLVDNGQHILMGCYTETLEFLDLIGARHLINAPRRLDVPFLSERRGATRLTAPPLPAPLHLAGAIFRFNELSLLERARTPAVIASVRSSTFNAQWKEATVHTWLTACHQSPNAIRAAWEPLCVAALNEPVATASALLFAEVLRRAFLGPASAASILLPRVGLSDLFVDQVRDMIQVCGGTVLTGRPVSQILFNDRASYGVLLDNGQRLAADAVVSAVPWHALRRLIPQDSALAERIRPLVGAPIVGIHLWFDRPVFDGPFVGFLDSPIHWVFNRAAITDLAPPTGPSLALVISGAYEHIDWKSAELVQLALRECRRLLPSARDATLQHQFVYKARDATFQARPSMLPHRPPARTEWENFALAGDWTDTGLPATIEGAVLSGRRAASLFR